MCYNCGCGMPDDAMGKGRVSEGGGSLTEHDIKHIAEKSGMTEKEVKQNIFDMLKKQGFK